LSRGDRPEPGRQRTEAERERDRLERERRRAGLPPVAVPFVPPLPPPESPTEGAGSAALAPDVAPALEPAPPGPLREQVELAGPGEPDAPPAQPAQTQAPRAQAPGGNARTRRRLPGLVALVVLLGVGVGIALLAYSLLRPGHKPVVVLPKVVRVLIPEGETRAQIAQIAKADGLKGSYAEATVRSTLLSPSHYDAPKGTSSLEGFLFPATYDMNTGEPAKSLVDKQLVAFSENFGSEEIRRAHELHITPYDLLIVASMIEREAQVAGDRSKIAAVIYNRLAAGIPLGIDATIYYAVELEKGIPTYTHELTESQLHIDSPYNTRLHKGLPPTPISNPGVASIHAAAHPAHVGYLYYVAAADGCGEQVFSDGAAEFEANVNAYHEAVAKNGGHPPSCKKK
jgi:cell division protein YceG involved in septum cleavage